MKGYKKRERIMVIEGDGIEIIRILNDLGVPVTVRTARGDDILTMIRFRTTLPLYDKLKETCEKNDIEFVCFDE